MDVITIVTVCYNAIDDIEKTIVSVINQTYQNINYIVIDGKSTDGTMDIVNKYSDKIDTIISEPDKGIYDAMNKGVKLAKGEWINFMNAGDTFHDKTTISQLFADNIPENAEVVFGDTLFVNGTKKRIEKNGNSWRDQYMPACHQSIFCKTQLLRESPFDLKYRVCADFNFFYHLKNKESFIYRPLIVAIYDDSKGVSKNIFSMYKEIYDIVYCFPISKYKYFSLCYKYKYRPFLSKRIKRILHIK